jgi:isoleucyl-tRNA synthetase
MRVLPYCWRDETPLSNHELRMDEEVYQPRTDQSVTITFPIVASGHRLDPDLVGVDLLAWTTTPWTLPTNMSCAVGPDVTYVVTTAPSGRRYLLAEALLAAYSGDLGFPDEQAALAAVTSRYAGTELAGLRYAPLWPTYADTAVWGTENAWQVLVEDYVTTTDGTGVVHQASAYGEDDQKSNEAVGIPTILSVDEQAKFLPVFLTGPLADIAGVQVFDANSLIVRHLRADGRLVRQASYVHSYPHCWRCRTPLIYKAVSSWFVEVTAFKDRMVELNQQIEWTPAHIRDGQFGKWLENARDWSISRNRFWGSPIPVWKSDDPAYPRIDVYGSFAELSRDFGVEVTDLHRPGIDDLVRPNPDDPTGTSMMRRIPDVLDVWFDSGSMPFAQVHYPFENTEWFEHHYPGDFIVEYIGQTRGWFYTLHILATALFDRPAFSACVSHGIVLGSDGQKMSKSLQNYPDVSEVFDRDGADAMRWFLMASPILRGGNLVVTEQGIRDGVRQVMIPLWNAWYFFSLYANAAQGGNGYDAQWSTASRDVLDRYLLAKLREFTATMQDQMDAFEVAQACDTMRGFLDVLTNWYIRRSRDRFWDGESEQSLAAFDTLYTALEVLTRSVAPLLPLMTEEIWRGLTGGRSVHLQDWPEASELPADPELVLAMDRAREVCSVASSLRKAAQLRNRLPLARLTVVAPAPAGLADFTAVIADEVNVRAVELVDVDSASEADFGVSQRLSVNARAAGPRLGREVQTAIKGSKTGDWSVAEDGSVTSGGIALVEGEYALETVVAEAAEGGPSRAVAMLPSGGFVVLDTTITDALRAEGLARDVIRAVQQARRDAGLHVSDRILLTLGADGVVAAAVGVHRELVAVETLASSVVVVPSSDPLPTTATGADGDVVGILVVKA